jgi:heat shock protein HslJ
MKFSIILSAVVLLSLLIVSCNQEPVELSDHDWRVTEVTGVSATKETMNNLSLEFGEGQEINGFAGCNDYRGGATYNREEIKFSTLYTDNANCEDINLEKRFLANLESSTSYTFSGNKLVFYDESGNIMVEMEKN